MTETNHQTIRLSDYRSPDYLIRKTELVFELDDVDTLVRSRMEIVGDFDAGMGKIVTFVA